MAIRSTQLARGFFVAAAVTVPWTIYLAIVLPKHYTAHHYWLAWTGFDIALIVALAITGRSLLQGDVGAHRSPTIAATLLIVDAWFDVLNAATPTDQLVALAMAALVELPLAFVCWRIARNPPTPNNGSSRSSSPGTAPGAPPSGGSAGRTE